MQYIGNKQSLVPIIHNIMNKHEIKGNTMCDLFAGTHSVGNYFKDKGFTVFSNDWQYYSFIFGKALIENINEPLFEKIIEKINSDKSLINISNYERVINFLNSLEGINGFFYNNYCPGGTKDKEYERLYFSNHNGRKFDAIRTKIEEWKNNDLLNEMEYYILIATAVKALDSVSNTTSVYGAFLKQLKGAAIKEIQLQPLLLNIKGSNHKVFNGDANEIAKTVKADIFYLDPPYNTRQYSSNYHVLETAALYDNPILYGKTGLRDYEHQKSKFSSKAKVKSALNDLIKNIDAKYILLSYNNEGILTDEDIIDILSTKGDVYKEEIEYKRFKSDRNKENRQYKDTNIVKELLYILKIK